VNFGKLFSRAGKLVADNSPLILTALGVTGTVTTVVLTARGSFEAAEKIRDEKDSRLIRKTDAEGIPLPDFDTKAKAKLVWKCYIPAAGSLVLTVACVVTANRIGTRRAAALAAAYSLAKEGWEEYKDKIIETIGVNKEQKARDAIAQDHITKDPPVDKQIHITGDGEVLCRDEWTGRYFRSNASKLEAAVNQINHDAIHNNYATLTDWYHLIGLPRVSQSDELGWNSGELMSLSIIAGLTEKQEPCLSIDFNKKPIRDYFGHH
jgi:hypothetical protein